MDFLNRMERKYGRYAVRNLMMYILGINVIGYITVSTNPRMYSMLCFSVNAIMHGEIWRIITFIMIPSESNMLGYIIFVLLYYSVSQALERTWGSFKLDAYIITGLLGTILSGIIVYMITGIDMSTMSIKYLCSSLFLALAFTYPDMEFWLYFIIRIKAKWLALFSILMYVYEIFRIVTNFGWYPLGLSVTVMIAVSLINFMLFYLSIRKYGMRVRFFDGSFSIRNFNVRNLPRATTAIVLINIIIQCAVALQTAVSGSSALSDAMLLSIEGFNENHEIYRIFTAFFLHFGWFHLINNMIVLFYVGSVAEKVLDWKKVLLVYIISGLIGNIASLIWYNAVGELAVQTAGASGAVFGMVGLIAGLLLYSRGRVREISINQIILLVIFSLYGGIAEGGVNNCAHIAGFITGFAAAFVICMVSSNKSWMGTRKTAKKIRFSEKSQNVHDRPVHKCTVCGRTDIDHPELEFRYCSKCDGAYEYCNEHLYTHKHITEDPYKSK